MGYALLWLLRVLEELDAKFRFMELVYDRFEIGVSHVKSVLQRSNSQLKTLLKLLLESRILEETLAEGYTRFRRGKLFNQTLQAIKLTVKIFEGKNLDIYEASTLAEALENDQTSKLISHFLEEPEILTQPTLKRAVIRTILRGENQLVRLVLKPARRAKIRLRTAKEDKTSIPTSPHHQPPLPLKFSISNALRNSSTCPFSNLIPALL